MIYTCYEMIRDCRANLPAGWRYFVRQYVPAIRKLLEHYGNGKAQLEPVLAAVRNPQSSLFQMMDPAPERPFLAELRQQVVAQTAQPVPSIELALDAVAAAWQPLTLVEKQAAWLETMRYSPAETGELLRMSAATVQKIRARAADLIRGQVDTWNTRLLMENGQALGRAAAATRGADCLPAKAFLDVLDGRTTWQGRERMEPHVLLCWYCIDHFCRLLEVVAVLRAIRPLTEEEAAPLDRLLGVAAEKPGGLRRWFGGSGH
jgi:hypothetical protein